jgi:hypothetical protein
LWEQSNIIALSLTDALRAESELSIPALRIIRRVIGIDGWPSVGWLFGVMEKRIRTAEACVNAAGN